MGCTKTDRRNVELNYGRTKARVWRAGRVRVCGSRPDLRAGESGGALPLSVAGGAHSAPPKHEVVLRVQFSLLTKYRTVASSAPHYQHTGYDEMRRMDRKESFDTKKARISKNERTNE